MAEHQGTDATLSWPQHDPLVGIHQAGWGRFPADIGWGHCVTLSFTRWKGTTGIALPTCGFAVWASLCFAKNLHFSPAWAGARGDGQGIGDDAGSIPLTLILSFKGQFRNTG